MDVVPFLGDAEYDTSTNKGCKDLKCKRKRILGRLEGKRGHYQPPFSLPFFITRQFNYRKHAKICAERTRHRPFSSKRGQATKILMTPPQQWKNARETTKENNNNNKQ